MSSAYMWLEFPGYSITSTFSSLSHMLVAVCYEITAITSTDFDWIT